MGNKIKSIALLIGLSSSVLANTNINSIDMFNNKTFVNQNINLSKESVDLLGKVKLEDIRFILKDGCKIDKNKIEYIPYKSDEIEYLKDKIQEKENKIKSLQSNISFLEKTSLSTVSSIDSLAKTSTFIKKEILDNYNLIYTLKKQIEEETEKLNELNNKRVNNQITKLNYKISCPNSNEITLSYPIKSIFKNSFYEINFNSKTNKLEIKNSSFITQKTGIDLKDIDINLYTYNYIYQLKPNIFIPDYLDLYKKQEIVFAKTEMMDTMPMAKSLRVSKKPNYSYLEDTTKSFFRASNITLKNAQETQVIFTKDEYNAVPKIEIDGYSSSQAFFNVNFKSKKLYGVSNAKLYLNGTYIGRTNIQEIKKDKKSDIFFGTNRFIDVKKELIKDMKEEPFFTLNKLKTQKVWKYTIKNTSKETQNLSLIERVPVSKHEDIKVKLIGKTKESQVDKNGKIFFDFKLKANESKIIEFGYEIEKPNKI